MAAIGVAVAIVAVIAVVVMRKKHIDRKYIYMVGAGVPLGIAVAAYTMMSADDNEYLQYRGFGGGQGQRLEL